MLAGGGHSHALLLRRWRMRPELRPAHTEVWLVSRASTALYSGMVPGLVAGLYDRHACAIDLRSLCQQTGVIFVQAEISGLDLAARELQLRGRPPLRFDRLSINVGAETRPQRSPVSRGSVSPGSDAAQGAQPVKPLEPFLAWADHWPRSQPLRIRGSGAAAAELALAFRARGLTVQLLLQGCGIELGSAAANRRLERELVAAGIALERSASDAAPADLLCTGSWAPAWLAASGLPVDASRGRVLTEPSLEVRGVPGVFACGDCAVVASAARPASGVWAVRAAPLLSVNLRRSLEQPGRALRAWRPQRWALQLLGDGGVREGRPRALACYGPWAVGPSRLLWHWKDRIDRRFMAGFAVPAAMGAGLEPMACRGCAAKLAAEPLTAALARLNADGAVPEPQDAVAVAHGADGSLLLQSVDGFPALVEDPWLNARLTTLHACSDLWACGAQVQSVQALVTVPEAAPGLQEQWLLHTLAGIRSVLDPMGAELIGGHSLEGRDGAGHSLALCVNGTVSAASLWPKGPLQPGDGLLLARAIGSGVLFAAAMAGAVQPQWLDAALAAMQRSQAPLVALLARFGCRACTDITGFGLLGHLGEMLAPQLSLQLDAAAIPSYGGALELLAQGFASSLAPANAAALELLAPAGPVQLVGAAPAALQQLLIDPQTCGPLLAAVPMQQAEAAVAALHAAGWHEAAVIGRVQAAG